MLIFLFLFKVLSSLWFLWRLCHLSLLLELLRKWCMIIDLQRGTKRCTQCPQRTVIWFVIGAHVIIIIRFGDLLNVPSLMLFQPFMWFLHEYSTNFGELCHWVLRWIQRRSESRKVLLKAWGVLNLKRWRSQIMEVLPRGVYYINWSCLFLQFAKSFSSENFIKALQPLVFCISFYAWANFAFEKALFISELAQFFLPGLLSPGLGASSAL